MRGGQASEDMHWGLQLAQIPQLRDRQGSLEGVLGGCMEGLSEGVPGGLLGGFARGQGNRGRATSIENANITITDTHCF